MVISSPERIAANKANAQKSTGPVTAEGKEASRANSLKHGLTGAGIVMAEKEGAEVRERSRQMRAEMKPATTLGGILVDRMATQSVRFERCALEERVRLAAMNDGEGGLIDLSREGQLAHRYEQAAHRQFDKSLAEFRKVEAEARANGVATTPSLPELFDPLASFGNPEDGDDEGDDDDEDLSLAMAHLAKFAPDLYPSSPKLTTGYLPISAAAGPDPVG